MKKTSVLVVFCLLSSSIRAISAVFPRPPISAGRFQEQALSLTSKTDLNPRRFIVSGASLWIFLKNYVPDDNPEQESDRRRFFKRATGWIPKPASEPKIPRWLSALLNRHGIMRIQDLPDHLAKHGDHALVISIQQYLQSDPAALGSLDEEVQTTTLQGVAAAAPIDILAALVHRAERSAVSELTRVGSETQLSRFLRQIANGLKMTRLDFLTTMGGLAGKVFVKGKKRSVFPLASPIQESLEEKVRETSAEKALYQAFYPFFEEPTDSIQGVLTKLKNPELDKFRQLPGVVKNMLDHPQEGRLPLEFLLYQMMHELDEIQTGSSYFGINSERGDRIQLLRTFFESTTAFDYFSGYHTVNERAEEVLKAVNEGHVQLAVYLSGLTDPVAFLTGHSHQEKKDLLMRAYFELIKDVVQRQTDLFYSPLREAKRLFDQYQQQPVQSLHLLNDGLEFGPINAYLDADHGDEPYARLDSFWNGVSFMADAVQDPQFDVNGFFSRRFEDDDEDYLQGWPGNRYGDPLFGRNYSKFINMKKWGYLPDDLNSPFEVVQWKLKSMGVYDASIERSLEKVKRHFAPQTRRLNLEQPMTSEQLRQIIDLVSGVSKRLLKILTHSRNNQQSLSKSA